MAAPEGGQAPAPAALNAEPAQATLPAAGGKSTHTLQNPGEQKMIFKVKSSNNNEYRVNPVFGFVDASGNTPIEVTRLVSCSDSYTTKIFLPSINGADQFPMLSHNFRKRNEYNRFVNLCYRTVTVPDADVDMQP